MLQLSQLLQQLTTVNFTRWLQRPHSELLEFCQVWGGWCRSVQAPSSQSFHPPSRGRCCCCCRGRGCCWCWAPPPGCYYCCWCSVTCSSGCGSLLQTDTSTSWPGLFWTWSPEKTCLSLESADIGETDWTGIEVMHYGKTFKTFLLRKLGNLLSGK